MVRINRIDIQGIGPIKTLTLNFDKSFNIICGQNGIGKTTILDCVAQSFTIQDTSLRRSADAAAGSWKIEATINSQNQSRLFNVSGFHPLEHRYAEGHGFYENANEVIVFKTHRDIPYARLKSLSTDPDKNVGKFSTEALSGSLPTELKNWFVNRHLWSKHEHHLDAAQIRNIELAKESFGILNPEVSFSKVVPSSNDIMLRTPAGEIYFEYLSSGYKSCMAVLLGLIKEVEFRYKNPSRFVREFDGVVFIDEVDLHLHPEWQAKIYHALKAILPKAQLFTSTHSPHIIQVATPNEIIPLVQGSDGKVKLNPLMNQEFGCQGWTVEEILEDVMGMKETRTELYLKTMSSFNQAVDEENWQVAKEQYAIIDKMLHPENALRKILKIQLAGTND